MLVYSRPSLIRCSDVRWRFNNFLVGTSKERYKFHRATDSWRVFPLITFCSWNTGPGPSYTDCTNHCGSNDRAYWRGGLGGPLGVGRYHQHRSLVWGCKSWLVFRLRLKIWVVQHMFWALLDWEVNVDVFLFLTTPGILILVRLKE